MPTIFAAAAILTATVAVTSAVGISITSPAFGQELVPPDGNVTGGNVTEGNVTAPVLGDGGAATPPVLTP